MVPAGRKRNSDGNQEHGLAWKKTMTIADAAEVRGFRPEVREERKLQGLAGNLHDFCRQGASNAI